MCVCEREIYILLLPMVTPIEERKEGNVLLNTLTTFLFTFIWRRTYGKRPFGWGSLSD